MFSVTLFVLKYDKEDKGKQAAPILQQTKLSTGCLILLATPKFPYVPDSRKNRVLNWAHSEMTKSRTYHPQKMTESKTCHP